MFLRRLGNRVDRYFCDRARERGKRRSIASAADIRVLDLPSAWIRVLEVGSGPDFVMLPDPPNTIEHHAALIERLRHSHRVICFEFPGFGRSYPKPSMPFTLDGLATVFREVFHALKATDAVLAISCLAAYAGINFAVGHPGLVRKLALIQAPAIGEAVAWSRKADIAGLIATPIIGQVLTQCLQPKVIGHWYQSALGVDAEHPRCRHYVELALDAVRQGSCFCLASAYQMLQAGPTIDWERLRQPALLVFGARDPTHGATRWDLMQTLLPGCRLERFADSTHFPNLEEPDRFAALMRQWT
jgi:pimeloyl-ACP methyl ester carboxylesterase